MDDILHLAVNLILRAIRMTKNIKRNNRNGRKICSYIKCKRMQKIADKAPKAKFYFFGANHSYRNASCFSLYAYF